MSSILVYDTNSGNSQLHDQAGERDKQKEKVGIEKETSWREERGGCSGSEAIDNIAPRTAELTRLRNTSTKGGCFAWEYVV